MEPALKTRQSLAPLCPHLPKASQAKHWTAIFSGKTKNKKKRYCFYWHHPLSVFWYRYWFQIGKGVRQGCILSPCLFNFYAENIMRNAGLEEAQPGIKIVRRNISNLRYADDTTLMAESEEELKSPLMKVKEESEKVGLKLNIQKTTIMASGPITHGN